jgi:Family of unknown function (DUF5522)
LGSGIVAVFDNFYEKLRKIVSPGDEIIESAETKPTPKPESNLSQSKSTTPQLVEGVDFYWEGPYMVLTAKYLFNRGYCCESGCRHCPYGFNKKLSKKS